MELFAPFYLFLIYFFIKHQQWTFRRYCCVVVVWVGKKGSRVSFRWWNYPKLLIHLFPLTLIVLPSSDPNMRKIHIKTLMIDVVTFFKSAKSIHLLQRSTKVAKSRLLTREWCSCQMSISLPPFTISSLMFGHTQSVSIQTMTVESLQLQRRRTCHE